MVRVLHVHGFDQTWFGNLGSCDKFSWIWWWWFQSEWNVLSLKLMQSVQLDKRTGKKCYMLSARNLDIEWGDAVQHWEWTSLPESRL